MQGGGPAQLMIDFVPSCRLMQTDGYCWSVETRRFGYCPRRERVPADGVIESGASAVEGNSGTGELLRQDKSLGAEIFLGAINGNALLRIRISRCGSYTTLGHVIEFVMAAQQWRSPVERLAEQYAKYLLPALLIATGPTFFV